MLADKTTIAETAATFGVSLRTLRFYEERGLIAPRRHGTARIYSSGDRVRLRLIATGKRLGLSLAHIGDLIGDRTMTRAKADELAAAPPGSIADLLTRDEVEQQMQMLERQIRDVEAAIVDLNKAYASAT